MSDNNNNNNNNNGNSNNKNKPTVKKPEVNAKALLEKTEAAFVTEAAKKAQEAAIAAANLKAYKGSLKSLNNQQKKKSLVLVKLPYTILFLLFLAVALGLRVTEPKTVAEVYQDTFSWVLIGVSLLFMTVAVYKDK